MCIKATDGTSTICRFCGELFALQLPPHLAVQLNLSDAELVCAQELTEHTHEPHSEPPVQLEQVEIDSDNAFNSSKPVTGTLNHLADQTWVMPLAIQAACEPTGRNSTVLYHHLDHLPRGEGSIPFHLPPLVNLQNCEGQPFTGLLPNFFQIGVVGEPEKMRRSGPDGPACRPGHFRPPVTPSAPPQIIEQKLSERFVPPTPTPTLITPEKMLLPSFRKAFHAEPPAVSNPNRFWSIGNIRAVLVEVKPVVK